MSGLVGFSGGVDSVFAFLFVLVAVYGALLFERRGALATAALAVFAHGLVLLAADTGWLPAAPLGAPGPRPLVLAVWAVNAGAVLLVAVLASLLGTELKRTGEALRERTQDLSRLARLHQHTVESLMSGLLTTDRDGRITSFNPEAERITGRSAAAALGRDRGGRAARASVSSRSGGRSTASRSQSRVRTAYTSERGERLHLGLGAYVLKDAEGTASGSRGDLPGRDAGGRDGARAAPLGAAGGDRPALGEHRARDPQSAGRDLRLDPGAGKAHTGAGRRSRGAAADGDRAARDGSPERPDHGLPASTRVRRRAA